MKRDILRRLFALCLALALLVPVAGLAEADDSILAVEAAPEEATEASVEEATGLLGGADSLEAVATAAQNDVPSKIQLKVGEKYTLKVDTLVGVKLTFKSSKSSVAKVSSKGVITAKKAGTAKIKCYADGDLLATCTVKVASGSSGPTWVKLNKSSITIGVKEKVKLTASVNEGSKATFSWSSKKKSIATVSSSGVITGKKAGTTTVTVKTQNGLKATVTVKVKKAPGKVTLNKTSKTLKIGGTVSLKAKLPSGTASNKLTWTSSDVTVATVSSSGKVTAVGAGAAKITVKTFNGRTATCTVTVKGAQTTAGDDTVKYRALLIGEENFSWDVAPRNRGDVSLMASMLSSVKGLYGGSYEVTRKYDLSTSQILSAIKTAFADADDNDVSLFFIATHGDSSYSGEYAGALATSPDDVLLMKQLANALKAVPGKVIVLLESCGSGAAIYGNSKNAAQSAQAFDQAAVQVFAAADPGIVVEVQSGEMTSSGVVRNTGEFRLENKFYVLAASAYQEDSWGTSYWNFFTKWLTDGVGTSGSMPADSNRNGQTTLYELYDYISRVGDGYGMSPGDGEIYYQHVQVYPKNSSYVLFIR